MRILQLQNNFFTGELPGQLGSFKRLTMLDVGGNKLSGRIPEWIGMSLEYLVVLRLSSNSFSGSVPLQGFNASVYAGNQDLCGLPLPIKCGDEPIHGPPSGGKHEDDANVQEHAISYDQIWLYSSIALGFIVGFWGVCGSLLLKSSWRHAYFQSVENIRDRLYVTVVVSVANLRRNFKAK
ncbi:Serine/threonine-protein kinase BRI1-like 2 [Morella rubra]|uniref:Serine/threonine-protein kinase BRI1-like 2 n=1 Tax=Morella rubra TaxID=262757 RepID=A0A6A1UX44_9ROSI|nr:Serine/threonine-protein kinase BRI1-like 2 [Morella rubra]